MVNRGNLDNGFGIILALASASFIAVLAYRPNFNSLFLLLAALPSTILYPFYVGYWRGAVTKELDIERIRGWTILIVGSSAMLALITVDLSNMVWPEYLIVPVGLFVAWYMTKRLVHALSLNLTTERRLALVGSAIAGFLAPMVATVTALILEAATIASNTLGIVTSYAGLAWGILTVLLFVVGAERTCEALIGMQTSLEDFDKKSTRLGRYATELRKGIFTAAFEFGFIAVNFAHRHREILALFLASTLIFGSLDWFFRDASSIGWPVVALVVAAADLTMCATIVLYRRIEPEELLRK